MSTVGTPLIMTPMTQDTPPRSESPASPQRVLSSPEEWVDRYGDALFAFTVAQVRDPHVAEDIVQEALLAAFAGRDSFAGQSHERTWLIGILKHKIIDHLRRAAREREHRAEDTADLPHFLEHFFDRGRGKWKQAPLKWTNDANQHAENREFWKVVHACVGRLSPTYAEAFCLREMSQMNTDDVCELLGISSTNLGVRLHRARLLLRTCLERHWFSDQAS